jgi:hypothetical protein
MVFPFSLQGLEKLDVHLASIRSFLDNLAMPQPLALMDSSAGGPIQVSVHRLVILYRLP